MAALIITSLIFGNADERVLYATRTFFGVYRVSEDSGARYHALAHGTTLHGMQALAPARRYEALTYFHKTGPFGQAWGALPAIASAAINLSMVLSRWVRGHGCWFWNWNCTRTEPSSGTTSVELLADQVSGTRNIRSWPTMSSRRWRYR